MKTACGKSRKCKDHESKWCIGYSATMESFEYPDDKCVHVGRKGNCTNESAWPENQPKDKQDEK